ncbi:3-keto-5-aminohexanoate cleavage protein [uncultured Cohaesibacter sp.]|uniref:3-keto-5-aminohexanoate cleavage protein n=1 Tax=uncultured Cohaesibacter sp. TaxID=1002546 RepID=UPI0029C8509E|nr:3-keto-5-aminohexanoate cleavage protein [uncultured Cohaesibacter sp.]
MTAPMALVPLPAIMIAPNGARKGKADHPALPVTIEETVATAIACQKAGADGIHAHVRDADGRHSLDAGLYRELLAELTRQTPDLYAQITTEAVGQYSPSEQRAVVEAVAPSAVSISVREMLSDGETPDIRRFYHEQAEKGVAIQHILYSREEVELLTDLCQRSIIPHGALQLLFVLGRYTEGQVSSPEDLLPFVSGKQRLEAQLQTTVDWACCAFGARENACLLKAESLGGKVRIGFENNMLNADGSLANDNAERVSDLIRSRAERL